MQDSGWLSALAVIAAFLIADNLQSLLSQAGFYRPLYRQFPFYVPEGGKSLLQIFLCVAAVRILWVSNARAAIRELGMLSSVKRGFLFGVVAASPMYVGFALTTALPALSSPAATAYLAGLSPLAEETLYRGFLCGLLCVRGGLSVWVALTAQAVIFGWGHVDQGGSFEEAAGLFAFITTGGFFLGWFFLRWKRNLWVPFFLHAFMNLSWEIFQVSDNALGGWYPFSLQSAAILTGILITIRWTPPIGSVPAEPHNPAS